MNNQHSRRDFLKNAGLVAGAMTLAPYTHGVTAALKPKAERLEVHVFSKHLQFLSYPEMAAAAAEIGLDGIDLTVRPKGHVLPEKVAEDLAPAVDAIRKVGLKATMMTTGVNNIDDALNRKVLTVAAANGIKYYRMAYISYPKEGSIPEAMTAIQKQMKKLAKFNKKLGLKGAYQNHAGTRVGAMIWDIWHLLEKADKEALGCQYDIRHAIVEGGQSWETGLRLIQPRIHSIVLKDFVWKKVDGKWKVVNVPLGEGMVDFKAYFKLLKQYGISVPASLHLEYDLGGAEHGDRDLSKEAQKKVFAAMKRDLELARRLWREVGA